MLQISTGKFFKYDAYETPRRATFYTNYRLFRGDERIDTLAGSLQSVAGAHGLGAVTCEIIERIQKMPGGPYPGEIVATGDDTLINDFAAIVSFALNITCTTDLELARRLVASERPSLGADLVPQKHVPRIFDRAVDWQQGDADHLGRFVTDLMALERKSYEGAMRAIRRYVIGAHRIADDVNLAYALFVMSMESLAQKFDGFEPAWDDYDQNKRRRIDEALAEASEATAGNVRAAILYNEHVAIAQRFREFVLDHVGPGFFREEVDKSIGAVSRPDLSIALRQAYSIRSSYVHHLKNIPHLLVGIEGFHETMVVDGQPALTFAGLARVAHHVIMTFVARAPKTETEEFDWMKDLPGKLTMPLAPQHWIGNPQGFDASTAQQYLAAFIGQVVERLLRPSATLTDIRPVLVKVEATVPGLAKPVQRSPMLALYFIFNFWAPENARSARYHDRLRQVAYQNIAALQTIANEASDTLQGHLITTAIASRGEDADDMEMHLEEEIMAAMPKINRLLWVLDTSVTIAPLLGLFGTIIGMIQAFNVLSANGGPSKVTGGIADALVSTGAGLLIAIIAVYFVNYFNNLTRGIVHQLELIKLILINRVHGKDIAGTAAQRPVASSRVGAGG